MSGRFKVVLISTDEGLAGLGIRTLSSCLIAEGFETVLVLMDTLDETLGMFSWKDLEALSLGAGLVGISCMTHGVNKAIEVRKHLAATVKAPVVIGGIHASVFPESLINDFDLVCRGEGEDAIVELASRLRDRLPHDDIPGLWVKKGDSVAKNQAAMLRRDLDGYPFPDYDLCHQFIIRASRLIPFTFDPERSFVVLGSRGCPHSCTYCCNQALKDCFQWFARVRHYSIGYLIEHLKEVVRRFPAVKEFWIGDDTFFAKRLDEIVAFSKKYKEEIGKPFLILISPGTYDDNKMRPLVEAGMSRIIIGVQSGSDHVCTAIFNRATSSRKIAEIAEKLHAFSSRVRICYDFIGMNPFESEQETMDTIRFIRSLPPPCYINSNNLAFYPGTRLHERALEAGLDISIRIRHSEATVGYAILMKERIGHKLFHLIVLLMAGDADDRRIGRVRRSFVTDRLLSFYSAWGKRAGWLVDGFVSVAAFILYWSAETIYKPRIKKILGPRVIAWLRAAPKARAQGKR